MSEFKARLENLRGAAYYNEWGRIWLEIREEAPEAVYCVLRGKGYVTAFDLLEVADMLGTPFKPLVQSLEGERVLVEGTYFRLYEEGFRVEEAREKIRAAWLAAHQNRRASELTPILKVLQNALPL